MKNSFYLILIIISLPHLSFARERFPMLALNDCVEKNRTEETINHCEYENFRLANEALEKFYINIQNFLPQKYYLTLEESQLNWNNYADLECTIYSNYHTHNDAQKAVAKIHCLNHKIEDRIKNLIYIVMLWEEKLGSFKSVESLSYSSNRRTMKLL